MAGSVTDIYLPFKKELEPIVRMGENIAIVDKEGKFSYFKVVYIEPIQPIIFLETLTPYEKDHEHKLSEVELNDNEVGQWRLWVPDFVSVKFYHPRASMKWSTKSQGTYALPLSMAKENFLEFFTVADDVPLLKMDNPIGEAQNIRIILWGIKYVVRRLKARPREFTVLPTRTAEAIYKEYESALAEVSPMEVR